LVDPGLAEEADLSHYAFDAAGAYAAFATCDPGQAARVEALLRQTLGRAAQGLCEDEIERAKNKIATDAVVPAESPLGRLRDVGTHWLYLDEYLTLEEDVRRLMAVTLADVRELAEALACDPMTIVRLGPTGA
jgi:predicted Zn-dependent peptidase